VTQETVYQPDGIYVSNDGKVTFSRAGGLYTDEFQLTLSTNVSGGSVYLGSITVA